MFYFEIKIFLKYIFFRNIYHRNGTDRYINKETISLEIMTSFKLDLKN